MIPCTLFFARSMRTTSSPFADIWEVLTESLDASSMDDPEEGSPSDPARWYFQLETTLLFAIANASLATPHGVVTVTSSGRPRMFQ